jgi:hypothetical protein
MTSNKSIYFRAHGSDNFKHDKNERIVQFIQSIDELNCKADSFVYQTGSEEILPFLPTCSNNDHGYRYYNILPNEQGK